MRRVRPHFGQEQGLPAPPGARGRAQGNPTWLDFKLTGRWDPLPQCLTLQHPFATHTVAVSGTADSLMFATATLIRRVVFCQEMGVDPKLEVRAP